MLDRGSLIWHTTHQMHRSRKTPAVLRKHRARVARRLADLEHLLRGSLIERYTKCGKPGCHCVQGRGHGPAYYLSVTLAPGKTRSYYVPARSRRRVAQYLANYRALRALVETISRINWQLLQQDALDAVDGSRSKRT